MCEVAFTLASDQHKKNNTIESTSYNMQHQLSVMVPIKENLIQYKDSKQYDKDWDR